MYATSVCGLALYEGLPILDEFYRSFLLCDVRFHIVERLLNDMYTGHRTWRSYASTARDFTVDVTEARFSLWKAFDILPDEQELLEQELRAVRFTIERSKEPENRQIEYTPLYTDSKSPIQYYIEA